MIPYYARPAHQIKGTLQVPCPYCGEARGKKCRTFSGNKLQQPHALRIRKADEEGLLMPLLSNRRRPMERKPVEARPEFRIVVLVDRGYGKEMEEYLTHHGFETEAEAREYVKGIAPSRKPQILRVIAGHPVDHIEEGANARYRK